MKTNVCKVVMLVLIFLVFIALLCSDNNWSIDQLKSHATDIFIIIASIIIVLAAVCFACCHCHDGAVEIFFSNLETYCSLPPEKKKILKEYVESQGKDKFITYAIEHNKLKEFLSFMDVSPDEKQTKSGTEKERLRGRLNRIRDLLIRHHVI